MSDENNTTTIPLRKDTRKKLKIQRNLWEEDTYDSMLNRFVNEYGFLSNRE